MSVPHVSPDLITRERNRVRFQGQMARETTQARLEQRPLVTLHPDATVSHHGEVYAIEWLESGGFDTLSPTARYEVTVTAHSTGCRVSYAPVIRKERRSKATGRATVRYHSPAGNHSTRDDVQVALALLAAERLSVTASHEAQPYGGPRNEGDQVACAVVWP